MMVDFEPKGLALVTGGSKRLGKCISEILHASGYDLIIHYGQSRKEAETLSDNLNSIRPGSCQTIQANLSQSDSIELLLDHCASLDKGISLLVNNASAFYPTPLSETNGEQWDDIMTTNLKAPLFLSQGLATRLRKSKGVIINLVDIYSERPLRDHPIYNLSKAGIDMLTKTLALELAPEIRVNGVSPGAILWPEQGDSDAYQHAILNKVPLARCGQPEDIARTVLFLAESAYITGQIIKVDGGRSLNI